jgi:hypothetical protein
VARSADVVASNRISLVDGHIGEPPAAKIVETALGRLRSINTLVNYAGMLSTEPLTAYVSTTTGRSYRRHNRHR